MKSFPHDIQHDEMDCGPACLRNISKHFGKSYPMAYLRKISYTTREGSSLLGISKAAEEIGFRTLSVKVGFKKLKEEAPLPAIVHWNHSHFVVVHRITSKKVYVADPAKGLLAYKHEEFVKSWAGKKNHDQSHEGIALLIETTPAFFEITEEGIKEEKLNIFAFLTHYLRPHRKLMAQIILGLIIGNLLALLFPFLTQSVIDIGINGKDIGFVWLVLVGQLMITVGLMSLEIVRSWALLHVSRRMNLSLISDFFIKLMKLPIRYFDTRLTGDLMQRINDYSRIQNFLTGTTLSTLFSLFTALLYGTLLIFYNATLFSISIIGSALYIGWVLFFLKRRRDLDYKRFQQSSQTNSKIIEIINGMQEIKLHNAEKQKRWEWERIQVRIYKLTIQSLSLEQTQAIGSRLINELKNIVITTIAAKLVIDNKITLGMMVAVTYIIGQLNSPLMQFVGIIKSWQDARISIDRLAEIHLKENEIPAISGDNNLSHSYSPIPDSHVLRFENVSFRYDELSDNVLKNISLTIPARKVTAIVGASGSGKSTLLKLLMRYYAPGSGKILIGDSSTDIEQVDLYEWRHKFGVVMQEGFIFNDTIAANIAVGMDTFDIDKLVNAAEMANIKGFIDSLPKGFNTKIGPEGLGISTGQKQRILIARAIYKNPEIIFFDEATSALDANNEREIIENLEEFYKGKTVIVIAHRLSTVQNADKIIVINEGEIAEEGNHESLIEKRGFYYKLVKNQLQLGS